MKPFNLEEAKAGKPVCTKNGKDARIICFDAKVNSDKTNMIVLISERGTELIYCYNNDGTTICTSNDYNLMMKSIHHIGYINIYKNNNEIGAITSNIYTSYDDAKNKGIIRKTYINTIKIEWDD